MLKKISCFQIFIIGLLCIILWGFILSGKFFRSLRHKEINRVLWCLFGNCWNLSKLASQKLKNKRKKNKKIRRRKKKKKRIQVLKWSTLNLKMKLKRICKRKVSLKKSKIQRKATKRILNQSQILIYSVRELWNLCNFWWKIVKLNNLSRNMKKPCLNLKIR